MSGAATCTQRTPSPPFRAHAPSSTPSSRSAQQPSCRCTDKRMSSSHRIRLSRCCCCCVVVAVCVCSDFGVLTVRLSDCASGRHPFACISAAVAVASATVNVLMAGWSGEGTGRTGLAKGERQHTEGLRALRSAAGLSEGRAGEGEQWGAVDRRSLPSDRRSACLNDDARGSRARRIRTPRRWTMEPAHLAIIVLHTARALGCVRHLPALCRSRCACEQREPTPRF